eukprot:CAMPEP_0195289356 /NCGR_PEP_ID=MMETSP0707-20130614/5669_1 /TAXON_ID=33640 /ORGANISM="Asterionellopsis glacialis, Strain CCMP134" /LENGTH=339 /DNA_ID=CAMNT_0040349349 /DNA_START=116 /DNA_END=1135 /DNA_ORIENTATION=-
MEHLSANCSNDANDNMMSQQHPLDCNMEDVSSELCPVVSADSEDAGKSSGSLVLSSSATTVAKRLNANKRGYSDRSIYTQAPNEKMDFMTMVNKNTPTIAFLPKTPHEDDSSPHPLKTLRKHHKRGLSGRSLRQQPSQQPQTQHSTACKIFSPQHEEDACSPSLVEDLGFGGGIMSTTENRQECTKTEFHEISPALKRHRRGASGRSFHKLLHQHDLPPPIAVVSPKEENQEPSSTLPSTKQIFAAGTAEQPPPSQFRRRYPPPRKVASWPSLEARTRTLLSTPILSSSSSSVSSVPSPPLPLPTNSTLVEKTSSGPETNSPPTMIVMARKDSQVRFVL